MRLASFLLCLLLVAGPALGAPSGYASHRAVYAMKMSHSANGSELVDVRGSMTYEWQDACDGWTTTQDSQMKFFYQDGRTVGLGWKLSSWESKDGLRYRFLST
ncbi:MAG: EipB family protein, partial [Pseudolabrys sp.]